MVLCVASKSKSNEASKLSGVGRSFRVLVGWVIRVCLSFKGQGQGQVGDMLMLMRVLCLFFFWVFWCCNVGFKDCKSSIALKWHKPFFASSFWSITM
uniref:Transmembrane protein n=1 Tax=Lactuca sativa TaxID=4236 RepID=A0A9R1XSS9_LACSA|nr:hypothetical protein LSAT_V11C100015010 [Lactuca sativa]